MDYTDVERLRSAANQARRRLYKPYSERLKDPRWQRKRFEILQRDDFTCVVCGDKNNTLHVHHGYYERGLEPWEYDSSTLWTLCECCHEDIGVIVRGLHVELAKLKPYQLQTVLGHIVELREATEDGRVVQNGR